VPPQRQTNTACPCVVRPLGSGRSKAPLHPSSWVVSQISRELLQDCHISRVVKRDHVLLEPMGHSSPARGWISCYKRDAMVYWKRPTDAQVTGIEPVAGTEWEDL